MLSKQQAKALGFMILALNAGLSGKLLTHDNIDVCMCV